MDIKKSISYRIEETIERFLRFLIRYFRTVFLIIKSPLSPQIILNEIDSEMPRFVRPLSFLAIGAFAFSLLISVYPMGLMGMVDLIWFVDDIKETLGKNWMQAISITSMVTVGMPVILSVTGMASLSGLIFFKDRKIRTKWFEANAYAFGFQSISFLVVLSLDTLFYVFLALFRFLEPESLETVNTSSISLVLFLSLVIITVVWPLLYVCSAYSQLKQHDQKTSWYHVWLRGLSYYVVTFYIYAGAASALPYVEATYFKADEVEASDDRLAIHNLKFRPVNEVDDSLYLDVELVFDNTQGDDLIIDTNDSEFEFELQVPQQENESILGLNTEKLQLNYPSTPNGLIRIEKNSYEILSIRFRLEDATQFYCDVIHAEKQIEREPDEVENSHLYLTISASVISNTDDIVISQFVDIDDLYGALADSDDSNQQLCVD